MSRGFVFSTWNQQTFWRHGGGLPCIVICNSFSADRIVMAGCLDKDDLLLHRWCLRVQDTHCHGARASAGRVIKAWLLPRIQSEMKKVHGLHRAGFWVLLTSEVKTCSFNGVWCKNKTVSVCCQAQKGMVKKDTWGIQSLSRNWGMRIRTGWVHGLLDVSCYVKHCLLHTATMCLCMIDWMPASMSCLWFDVLAAVWIKWWLQRIKYSKRSRTEYI